MTVLLSRFSRLVTFLSFLLGAVAPVAEAQPPIRIGATLPLTGTYAAGGQTRGPSRA